jgi:predicted RNA-binding Zn ribbon-like protein
MVRYPDRIRYDSRMRLSPFRFVGGQLVADFVNTVDWGEPGVAIEGERLPTPEAWRAWLEAAGVVSAAQARRLPVEGRSADRALKQVHATRALMHRILTALARGRAVSPDDRAALARLASGAASRRRLEVGASGAEWRWEVDPGRPERWLDPVVWDAADLLAGRDRARIRACDGPRCGWVFVDRSRNGRRRWCAMDMCGSRAKARAYYARTRRGDR